jgi:hypothetical protein
MISSVFARVVSAGFSMITCLPPERPMAIRRAGRSAHRHHVDVNGPQCIRRGERRPAMLGGQLPACSGGGHDGDEVGLVGQFADRPVDGADHAAPTTASRIGGWIR